MHDGLGTSRRRVSTRVVGVALLLFCAAWWGPRTFAPGAVFATDPGAATSSDSTVADLGPAFEQACANRSDPNAVLVNFGPQNATLYVGGSLTMLVDICLGADANVGVALEEDDGVTDDRFDVATVNTQAVQTKRVEFYLHCHKQGALPYSNYLEGHQGNSVEQDNMLDVALVGYDPGDQSDIIDNWGATQGRPHVQCVDVPPCSSATPGPGLCVGGTTHLSGIDAPLLTTSITVSGALLTGILAAGVLLALVGSAWWARQRAWT